MVHVQVRSPSGIGRLPGGLIVDANAGVEHDALLGESQMPLAVRWDLEPLATDRTPPPQDHFNPPFLKLGARTVRPPPVSLLRPSLPRQPAGFLGRRLCRRQTGALSSAPSPARVE